MLLQLRDALVDAEVTWQSMDAVDATGTRVG